MEPPPPRVTLLLRAAEASPETVVGATVRAAGPAAHNVQGFVDLNTGGYGSYFSFTPPPGARRTPEVTHAAGNRHGGRLTRRAGTSPAGDEPSALVPLRLPQLPEKNLLMGIHGRRVCYEAQVVSY